MKLLIIFICALVKSSAGAVPSCNEANIFNPALQGYDPRWSNTLQTPDPGKRGQIFNTHETVNGETRHAENFDKMGSEIACDLRFTTKLIDNIDEYVREMRSSFTFASEADRVSEFNETQFETANDLLNRGGYIVIHKVKCITHSVAISSSVQGYFTTSFKRAVSNLYLATKTPDPERARNLLADFVRSFGTHFMSSSYLGSSILIEIRRPHYRISEQTLKILDILSNAFFEGRFTAEAVNNAICNNDICSRSHVDIKIHSNGHLFETNHRRWAASASKSPVVVEFSLAKISSLLNGTSFPLNFENTESGTNETVNGAAVANLLERCSSLECTLTEIDDIIRPQSIETLPVHSKNEQEIQCRDDCSPGDAVGSNASAIPIPLMSLSMSTNIVNFFDAIFITGGRTLNQTLSSVLSLKTGTRLHDSSYNIIHTTLPELPSPQYGHVLVIFHHRAELIQSNGAVEESGPIKINIATLNSNSAWLPANGFDHEPYLAAGVFDGQDGPTYSFNNSFVKLGPSGLIETYEVKFKASTGHCIVSNGAHFFVIGVGENNDEIWVNFNDHELEDFKMINVLSRGRKHHKCLWIGTKIFVTGGEIFDGSTWSSTDSVEVIDTLNSLVKTTTSLRSPRSRHGMIGWNKSPAVIGGVNKVNGVDVRLIQDNEFLDENNTWTTFDLGFEVNRHSFGLAMYSSQLSDPTGNFDYY